MTAVLDDLEISEVVLLAAGALPTAALFAATYPSRTAALVVLEGYADPRAADCRGRLRRTSSLQWWACGAPESPNIS